MKRIAHMSLVVPVVLAGAFPAYSEATDYPSEAVTIVAPYGPGGSSDLAARMLADAASKRTGAAIMVENRAGAGGVTGSAYVMSQDPDGYTLLLARIGSQAVAPARDPKLPYAWDDFTFLGLLELNPIVCVANPQSPYAGLAELSQALVDDPGAVTFSSAGVGTVDYTAGYMLLSTLGGSESSAVHVPYESGSAAVTAVLSGNADYTCNNIGLVLSHIEAGSLNSLIVTTPSRLEQLPDVQTAREAGLESLDGIVGWSALYGPPDLPPQVVDFWEDMLAEIKHDEEWLESTRKLGSVPHVRSSAETQEFVENQFNMYRALAEDLNLMVN